VLAPAGRKALFGDAYSVSREADRMGYRLEGRELELKGEELISFGLAFGAVQVPNSGQPILLMADHQTAGGYPAVAGVARADLPLAAQLVPGDKVRFEQVTVESAQQAWRALRAGLDTLKA
jgi:allophanate hydrolase subunit 2